MGGVSEHDEWMAKHKGEYLYSWGQVWTCEDECECSEAQVIDYYQNKVVHFARVPVTVWSGDWHVRDMDEPGSADADLAAYRRELRESDPEREAAIRWQSGVDYGIEEQR